MQKLKTLILSLIVGVTFAGGITYAAALWQGTAWIINGETISAASLKENLDYLKEQVADSGPWVESGSNIYFNTGNIGVGRTPSSSVKLYAYQTGNNPAIYGVTTGASYGMYGESGGTYGIYGKTKSASHGGVLGYAANGSTYGTLAYANKYTLYGNGEIYSHGRIRSATDMYAPAYYHSSDRRLKTNIKMIETPIEKVQAINGVTFDWRETQTSSVGVIAQDIEKILPELVTTDTDTGMKAVDYDGLIGLLIEAIKEQQREIDLLKQSK